MQLATGNSMLNFGYWKNPAAGPQEAQNNLCELIGKTASLESARLVLDVGSGFSAPAFYWKSQYEKINITCINTNFQQLLFATKINKNNISGQIAKTPLLTEIRFANATSTSLPLSDNSVDRIIALESAQHFKPVDQFIRESKRVLAKNGLFVIALPVINETRVKSSLFMKLGILSLTWASEHYRLDYIKSALINGGFKINEFQHIGTDVYAPLAEHYVNNRKQIREKILKSYPSYLENILHKSMLKMKEVSQSGIIDYAIIKCTPE
jgi:cyclopropane fatty-acyl-phospholipid synthase-like methyltransferase